MAPRYKHREGAKVFSTSQDAGRRFKRGKQRGLGVAIGAAIIALIPEDILVRVEQFVGKVRGLDKRVAQFLAG